ncbi:MAG: hypothetical protein U0166_20865 [Acidobacteriota bacterium]
MDPPQPVEGRPEREAADTIASYTYQIWHTLRAWLELDDEGTLYVETAEDFQIVTEGEARLVPVTAQAANVTLRSEKALDAIGHFWEYQQSDKRRLELHFLATARRGVEQGQPLGVEGGLRFWDRCRSEGVDLAPLRNFLAGIESLPSALRDFVRTASDEEIRVRLIRPIRWITEAEGQDLLEEEVARAADEVGEKLLSLRPSEARKVVPSLLKRVWEIAGRKGRRALHRSELRAVFEEASSVTITRSEMDRLLRLAVERGAEPDAKPIDTSHLEILDELPVAMPPGFVDRPTIVVAAVARVRTGMPLILHGATGMGKSTTARLVAAQLGGRWRRLQLRGRTVEACREYILALASRIRRGAGAESYLVDDFDASLAALHAPVAALVGAAVAKGVRLLFTGPHQLPFQVNSELGLGDEVDLPVPGLTPEESADLVRAHGCPDVGVKAWSVLVLAVTAGHPLLAHARVIRLKREGWPGKELFDVGPPELARVQKESRQRLRAELSNEMGTAAYRLSVFMHSFTKKQALAVISTGVNDTSAPGVLFDALQGPWLEESGEGRYRVNPLLAKAAQEVFDANYLQQLHYQAAEAILAGTVTYFELSGLLMHGLAGSHESALVHVVIGSQNALREVDDREQNRNFWLPSMWFCGVRLGKGEALYPDNEFVSHLLRTVQFRAASATGLLESLGEQIVVAWDAELDRSTLPEPLRAGDRIAFLGSLLGSNMSMPMDVRMSRSLALGEIYRSEIAKERTAGEPLVRDDGGPSVERFTTLTLQLVVPRIEGVKDLEAFLDGIAGIDDRAGVRAVVETPEFLDVVRRVLGSLSTYSEQASMLTRVTEVAGGLGCGVTQNRALAMLHSVPAVREKDLAREFHELRRKVEAETPEGRASALALLDAKLLEAIGLGDAHRGFTLEARSLRAFYVGSDEMGDAVAREVELEFRRRTLDQDAAAMERKLDEVWERWRREVDEVVKESEQYGERQQILRALLVRAEQARLSLAAERVRQLARTGVPSVNEGRVLDAMADAEKALAGFKETKERLGHARAALVLADLYWIAGNKEAAKGMATAALEVAGAEMADIGGAARRHLDGAPGQGTLENEMVRFLAARGLRPL